MANEQGISSPQVTLRTPEPQARIVDGRLELLIVRPVDVQDYYLSDSESYWYDVAPWGSYCYSRWTVYFTRGTGSYSLPVVCAVEMP
ncbi:MAG: hypothetical protein QMD88_03725 [Coprothermobacterota bacterium]|nr:hypothetical protein [Coprothermobacterota bacterium]